MGKAFGDGFIRRMIQQGYEPEFARPSFCQYYRFLDSLVEKVDRSVLAKELAAKDVDAIWVLASMVERLTASEQSDLINEVLSQLSRTDGSFAIIIGIQGESIDEVAIRMQSISGFLNANANIRVIGIGLETTRKTETLNAAFSIFAGSNYKSAGWIDDDVEISNGCLSTMYERLKERSFVGSVGPTKVGKMRDNHGAQLLFRVKAITTPATNYPHGCCILVDRKVVEHGIPRRYSSDDGFVCFSILAQGLDQAAYRMEVLEGPTCKYVVGAPKGSNLRRIRRLLINHWVFMSDFDQDTANYYWRNMLLAGFWPVAPLELSNGISFAAKKWGLKLIYFLFLLRVGTELFIRGLFNRPLRGIAWGGTDRAYLPREIPSGNKDTNDSGQT